MRILVVCVEHITNLPPVIMLCRDLLALRHRVTLLSCGIEQLPESMIANNLLSCVNLLGRPNGIDRVITDIKNDRFVNNYCKRHVQEFDLVWTATDLSARACGKSLLGTRHVMQMLELAEYVPALTRHEMPLKSRIVIELARHAHHVIVPEDNRAFIQQAWWQLPKRPMTLPNKSIVGVNESSREQYREIDDMFTRDKRKKLLYQGVFTADRDFGGLIRSMDLLSDEYVLFLMGVQEDDWERMEAQCEGRPNVVLVPFVPAPYHLLFTSYAHIGLLPYKPSYSRQSPLNALFCAPNKIWEYARYGLPMLGSCVPGLNSIFDKYGIGLTTDIDDPAAIANTVLAIEASWDEMSERSRGFYGSVDTKAIVERILGD